MTQAKSIQLKPHLPQKKALLLAPTSLKGCLARSPACYAVMVPTLTVGVLLRWLTHPLGRHPCGQLHCTTHTLMHQQKQATAGGINLFLCVQGTGGPAGVCLPFDRGPRGWQQRSVPCPIHSSGPRTLISSSLHLCQAFTRGCACRAMVALLVRVPLAGGLALAGDLCSPHLDVHQRLWVLDSLSAAAQEMAARVPRLGAGAAPPAALPGGQPASGEGKWLQWCIPGRLGQHGICIPARSGTGACHIGMKCNQVLNLPGPCRTVGPAATSCLLRGQSISDMCHCKCCTRPIIDATCPGNVPCPDSLASVQARCQPCQSLAMTSDTSTHHCLHGRRLISK